MQSEELEHFDKVVSVILGGVVLTVVVVGHGPQSFGHDTHVSSESHISLPQMGLFPIATIRIVNITKIIIIDSRIIDIFFCFLDFCFFALTI
jgi:hypothetical protein